jgi:hypothetical protein
MTKPVHFLLLSTVIALAAATAVGAGCGSSSGSGSLPTCKNPTTQQTTCDTCVTDKCPSEVSAVEDACGDYLSCIEACDCSDSTCQTTCEQSADSSCVSAIEANKNCAACDSECSSSVTVNVPVVGVAPADAAFPDGVMMGAACSGDIYVDATTGGGYAFCDDGVWAYTPSDPAADGFTLDEGIGIDGGSGDGGSTDGGSADSGSGDSGSTDGGSADGESSDAESSDGGAADTGTVG